MNESCVNLQGRTSFTTTTRGHGIVTRTLRENALYDHFSCRRESGPAVLSFSTHFPIVFGDSDNRPFSRPFQKRLLPRFATEQRATCPHCCVVTKGIREKTGTSQPPSTISAPSGAPSPSCTLCEEDQGNDTCNNCPLCSTGSRIDK